MEDMVADRRGDAGERREGLSGLLQASRDGHLVQIPGQVLTTADDDWAVVVGTLFKAQES